MISLRKIATCSDMKRYLQITVGSVVLGWAAMVFAADLDTAKSQGLIGERADGYLGVVEASAGADVRALVEEINGKRRAQYERIAAKNGIALTDVEARAGQKTIQKTAPGGWVFDGSWKRK